MYLTSRGGLSGLGMTLAELSALGYRIVADPQTPLIAAYATWQKVYADLADGFGAKASASADRDAAEKDMLATIDIDKLLAVERATVEQGRA
jgi:2-methylisocitrate lyase-like PEP mutase family enzyme